MVSESEEEENHPATSPRSRREQIQEVMESYKEKLMNIKGQVRKSQTLDNLYDSILD